MRYGKQIVQKTLWEQIADTLRENIIRGKIAPGERIVEEELALQYNVSRAGKGGPAAHCGGRACNL